MCLYAEGTVDLKFDLGVKNDLEKYNPLRRSR
jgi:hypothetical protein